MTALAEGGITLSDFTEDSFTGSITVTGEGKTVFTTIPYDAGWQITVDGVPVTGYETLDALLAFDLDEGTHTVELVYRPRSFVLGSVISVVSFTLFLALIALETCVRHGTLELGRKGRALFDVFMSDAPVPEEGDPFTDEAMGLLGEENEEKSEADDNSQEKTEE